MTHPTCRAGSGFGVTTTPTPKTRAAKLAARPRPAGGRDGSLGPPRPAPVFVHILAEGCSAGVLGRVRVVVHGHDDGFLGAAGHDHLDWLGVAGVLLPVHDVRRDEDEVPGAG